MREAQAELQRKIDAIDAYKRDPAYLDTLQTTYENLKEGARDESQAKIDAIHMFRTAPSYVRKIQQRLDELNEEIKRSPRRERRDRQLAALDAGNKNVRAWSSAQAPGGAAAKGSQTLATSSTTVDRTNQKPDHKLREEYRAMQREVDALLAKIKTLEEYAQQVDLDRELFDVERTECAARFASLRQEHEALASHKGQCDVEREQLKEKIDELKYEIRRLKAAPTTTTKRSSKRGVLRNLMRRRRRSDDGAS